MYYIELILMKTNLKYILFNQFIFYQNVCELILIATEHHTQTKGRVLLFLKKYLISYR